MIKVVAALIEKNNQFLIAKRSTGDKDVLGKWEFPGGKVEEKENEKQAIKREIYEEFEINIEVEEFITETIYQYPNKVVNLKLYKCKYHAGEMKLHSHSKYKWVKLKDIFQYDLAPADIELVDKLKEVVMDKGVIFTLEQLEKALKLAEEKEDLKKLKNKIREEYRFISNLTKTGDVYKYLKKFENDKHKYAEDFKIFKKYNILSNEEIVKKFKEMYSQDELEDVTKIEDLVVGNTYTTFDIRNVFECSVMGGMNRSQKTNTLVLIANHTDNTYTDEWDDNGILNYTGEGQIGDQDIEARQNKTLKNSNNTDIKVYLFEVYEETKYIYDGEVVLVGKPYQDRAEDKEGNDRMVWKFPIAKKDGNMPIFIKQEVWDKNIEAAKRKVKKLSDKELNNKLKNAKPQITKRQVITKQIKRNPVVVEKTYRRAKGICDLCKQKAPFNRKNKEPYLEVHHLIKLADDGPDHIYNTVALCPNCHRKMHILNDKKDFNCLKKVIYEYLEKEKIDEYIKKFNELFKES